MQLQNIVQSFVAAEAITEFALVSIDGNGKVTITDAGTEIGCVGVAQRACSAGETVDVVVFGTTRVIASAALTFGTTPLLTGAANGQVAAVIILLPESFPTSTKHQQQVLVNNFLFCSQALL